MIRYPYVANMSVIIVFEYMPLLNRILSQGIFYQEAETFDALKLCSTVYQEAGQATQPCNLK